MCGNQLLFELSRLLGQHHRGQPLLRIVLFGRSLENKGTRDLSAGLSSTQRHRLFALHNKASGVARQELDVSAATGFGNSDRSKQGRKRNSRTW